MTILSRIRSQGETILDFTTAAEEKYVAGFELVVQSRYNSGIYLMGYAAEMWLKSTYFHLRDPNLRVIDFVGPRLNPALHFARTNFDLEPTQGRNDLHDLRFWALLIRQTRRRQNRPLTEILDAQFVSRSRRLYQNWSVNMRYRADPCSEREALTVLDDVSWLKTNYFRLRR